MKVKAKELKDGMKVGLLTWVVGVRKTDYGYVYARYRTLGLFDRVERHRSSHLVSVKV